jgi:hypothetical protein
VGHGWGTDADRSNVIDEGIIEVGGSHGFAADYSCAISLVHAEETTITNIGAYDGDSSTALLCGDSTAIKNRVTKTNYVDSTGVVYTNGTWDPANDMPYRAIPFTFDGGGAVPAAATACSPELTFGGIINRFSMYGNASGNATIVVSAGSSPASQTTISSTETMSSAASLVDTTLAGWTYAGINANWLPPGSVVCVTLSSPATLHRLAGSLRVLEGR